MTSAASEVCISKFKSQLCSLNPFIEPTPTCEGLVGDRTRRERGRGKKSSNLSYSAQRSRTGSSTFRSYFNYLSTYRGHEPYLVGNNKRQEKVAERFKNFSKLRSVTVVFKGPHFSRYKSQEIRKVA